MAHPSKSTGISKWTLCGTAVLALSLTFAAPDEAYAQSGLFGDSLDGPYDWSGIFVGAHAGAAVSDGDWLHAFTTAGTAAEVDLDASGLAGGVHLGVQHQWDNIVAGVEASYSLLDLDDSAIGVPPGFTARDHRSEIQNLVLVKGRLGYANGNWLFYATGGYASADVDLEVVRVSDNSLNATSSGREHGWIAGGGVEIGLATNLIFGAEYNYIDLGSITRNNTQVPPFIAQSENADVEIHTIWARITFKFNPFDGN